MSRAALFCPQTFNPHCSDRSLYAGVLAVVIFFPTIPLPLPPFHTTPYSPPLNCMPPSAPPSVYMPRCTMMRRNAHFHTIVLQFRHAMNRETNDCRLAPLSVCVRVREFISFRRPDSLKTTYNSFVVSSRSSSFYSATAVRF